MSLLKTIIQGAYQGGKRLIPQRRFAPASLLDTATNPKTYQGLAQSASDTLGRALPPQFRGAGFQNVPAGALGALDDAAAAPFAGPVRQQILQKASKDFARKAGPGTTRVPVIPTGGQPVNASAPGRYVTLKDIPVTPGAAKGVVKNLTRGAPLVGGAIDYGRRVSIGENPIDAAGRTVFGTVGGTLGTLGAGALGIPTGPGAVVAGLVGSTTGYAGGVALYDQLRAESQQIRGRSGAKRATEDKEAGSRPIMNLPPSVNTNLAAYDEGVTLPSVSSAGNMGSFRSAIQARNTGAGDNNSNNAPLPPPPTNLPPSPEETPAMMDPYAYNLAVYGQGRTAAGTQEERKAVQNLGTTINQRLFPTLNNQTSFNPLMARTFPDRYPQSLEAFIEERGIQKPNSMNEVDAATALADATNAVEPLLTPEVAEQLRLLRQQGRL
jgi:hypothetical protein